MSIKDIFSSELPIKMSDSFIDELDLRRNRFKADKSLLEGDVTVVDIEKITDLPDGKIRVQLNGARFECFFHRGRGKKLYVILNGARTSSGGRKKEIPIYNRWSHYAFGNNSWLSIEDPMYYQFSDLLVGWFYGDKERNFREYVAYIVGKVSDFLKIDKNNVCFFGSSAGGTAAIGSAASFGYGTAISLNGQINFEYEHKDIANFVKQTGIDIHKKDKFNRNDICKTVKQSENVKFILIENCRSKWDFVDHLKYFCTKMQITPQYGISQFENIFIWIYDAPSESCKPHVAFEDKNIHFAIDFLATLARNGEDIENYQPLYLLFNEFWHDIYCPSNPSSKRMIFVQEKEYLTESALVEKLLWNREQRKILMKRIDDLSSH